MGGTFRLKKFLGVRADVPATALRADAETGAVELAPSPNVWPAVEGELTYVPVHQFMVGSNGHIAGLSHIALPAQMLLIPFDDETGAHHQVICVERSPGNLNTLVWALPGYGFSSLLYDPYASTALTRPGWVAWRGRLYLFFGADRAGTVGARAASGRLAWSDLGLTWPAGDQPRARTAWLYRNHLMLGGFDSPEESTVRNCSANDPSTLVASNLSFWLGRGDGDRIVGGMEFPVYGGSTYIEPYCFVWKERSTWMLQGPPPEVGDTSVAINVMNVLPAAGCVAKETVAATPHGFIWCSGDSVWMAKRGQQPVEVGAAIAPLLASRPRTHRSGWHAVYYNGVYRLSVPSTRTRLNAGTGWYLTDTEQWWLDLRRFEQDGTYAWWGPMDLPTTAMAVEMMPDKTQRLVGLVASSEGGPFYTCAIGETLPYSGVVGPGVFSLPNIALPDWELFTKEFDGGDENLVKVVESVELHAKRGASGNDMTVTLKGDDGTDSLALTGSVPVSETTLGSFVLDTSTLGAKFKAVSYYPSSRFLANTVQVRVALAGGLTGMPEPKLRAMGVRLRVHGRRS